MDNLRRLVREAHRRSLWQVLGIYLVAGWMALQVVQTLTESLGLPNWFPPFAIVLLIVGLPVVLATAFVQEGIGGRREGPKEGAVPAANGGLAGAEGTDGLNEAPARGAEAAPSPTQSAAALFNWRNSFGGAVLAFALWGVVAAAWLVFGAGTPGEAWSSPGGSEAVPVIAVLPFENLSADPEADQWFADGIHGDLISELANISGLTVISRASVLTYRRADRPPIPDIGRQLGASAILNATVRRVQSETQDQVRVTAELVDAVTGQVLWTKPYQEASADVFAIQADLARSIARELRAELAPEEEVALDRTPTDDAEAYDFYLRANAIFESIGSPLPVRAEQALALLERATELDPSFAEAHALRARVHADLYIQSYDVAPERLAEARSALETALRLDPSLAPARRVRANLLRTIDADDAAAEAELRSILADQPSAEGVHASLATLYYDLRRFGPMSEALDAALELDPRDPHTLALAAGYLTNAGNFDRAEPLLRRALSVDPTATRAYGRYAMDAMYARADTAKARTLMEEAIRISGRADVATVWVEQGFADYLVPLILDAEEGLLDAVDARSFSADVLGRAWYHQTMAYAALVRGNGAAARAAAAAQLRTAEEGLAGDVPYGSESAFRGSRAGALAMLGMREEALAEFETLRALSAGRFPADPAPANKFDIIIHVLLGDVEGAAAAVRKRAGEPDALPLTAVSVMPYWLMKDEPAFRAALAGG